MAEVAQGRRAMWVKLSEFGHTVNAKATFGADGIRLEGVVENTNPAEHEAFFEKFGQAVTSGSRDWRLTLGFSVRHDEWREAVGWLRVAYLYAFAAFGYRFVLRPELNIVREQLQGEDDRVLPQAMTHTEETSAGDGLIFVHAPIELRGLVVRLGQNLFWLPAFSDPATFYARLASYPVTGQQLTFSGVQIDLPTRPLLGFDFDPRSMRLAIPRDEWPRLQG